MAFGFNFRPPDTPMPQTNSIFMQRFWNDHVLHAGRIKPAIFSQISHAAKPTGLFITGSGDFDSTGILRMILDKADGCDDGRSQSPFHVAGTAPIDTFVLDDGCKGIQCPAVSRLNNIRM